MATEEVYNITKEELQDLMAGLQAVQDNDFAIQAVVSGSASQITQGFVIGRQTDEMDETILTMSKTLSNVRNRGYRVETVKPKPKGKTLHEVLGLKDAAKK